ncbi:hypothetical protein KIPB_000324 [Kipferlia bialata]|uniref:Uncharacterized protein n=1 Tax=Kipferlia bialata TaxID=797122 RepID=A0A9K3CN82_9EUKA|nr:hypothetical protein KIPB_000324 [Kipferlia bialata]|eukprot:g324.t1
MPISLYLCCHACGAKQGSIGGSIFSFYQVDLKFPRSFVPEQSSVNFSEDTAMIYLVKTAPEGEGEGDYPRWTDKQIPAIKVKDLLKSNTLYEAVKRYMKDPYFLASVPLGLVMLYCATRMGFMAEEETSTHEFLYDILVRDIAFQGIRQAGHVFATAPALLLYVLVSPFQLLCSMVNISNRVPLAIARLLVGMATVAGCNLAAINLDEWYFSARKTSDQERDRERERKLEKERQKDSDEDGMGGLWRLDRRRRIRLSTPAVAQAALTVALGLCLSTDRGYGYQLIGLSVSAYVCGVYDLRLMPYVLALGYILCRLHRAEKERKPSHASQRELARQRMKERERRRPPLPYTPASATLHSPHQVNRSQAQTGIDQDLARLHRQTEKQSDEMFAAEQRFLGASTAETEALAHAPEAQGTTVSEGLCPVRVLEAGLIGLLAGILCSFVLDTVAFGAPVIGSAHALTRHLDTSSGLSIVLLAAGPLFILAPLGLLLLTWCRHRVKPKSRHSKPLTLSLALAGRTVGLVCSLGLLVSVCLYGVRLSDGHVTLAPLTLMTVGLAAVIPSYAMYILIGAHDKVKAARKAESKRCTPSKVRAGQDALVKYRTLRLMALLLFAVCIGVYALCVFCVYQFTRGMFNRLQRSHPLQSILNTTAGGVCLLDDSLEAMGVSPWSIEYGHSIYSQPSASSDPISPGDMVVAQSVQAIQAMDPGLARFVPSWAASVYGTLIKGAYGPIMPHTVYLWLKR